MKTEESFNDKGPSFWIDLVYQGNKGLKDNKQWTNMVDIGGHLQIPILSLKGLKVLLILQRICYLNETKNIIPLFHLFIVCCSNFK